MAEIFKIPQGVKTRGKDRINYVAAHHIDTSAALEVHATAVFNRAVANLAAHRGTGASHITHERGIVDHYIVLNDDAAMSIEFGTDKIKNPPSPLRKAVRIE